MLAGASMIVNGIFLMVNDTYADLYPDNSFARELPETNPF